LRAAGCYDEYVGDASTCVLTRSGSYSSILREGKLIVVNELAVELNNVGLQYRSPGKTEAYWALRNATFEVYHGETLGVIGGNGSGKSTLLRLLAGIYAPDEGKVDRMGNSASLLALQVGFLPHLTGRQNALLSGMIMGESRSRMLELMPDIVDFAEIGEFFDEPLRTYSSGMKARLGFAAAYYSNPDILLIDEVLGVGDEDFRVKSGNAMHERIKSNQTVVVVSHALGTIKKLADRVLWMEKGKVKLVGPCDPVLEAYREFQTKLQAKKDRQNKL
jgi:lipopolysaccharide transport system ATP-binding protein